jgi:predicted phosphoribosyltransferase
MMFYDRTDAGRRLVAPLHEYRKQQDTVVLGLPRGGVITALEVAEGLALPLDVVVARKIGSPHNPELAIGAITRNGPPILTKTLSRSCKCLALICNKRCYVNKK